ncbi:O-methyltransferase 3 [Vigna angularis]|uniref:O-methyltransferase 3 n=1 Tax=Phaseolus angularis TaxID=3914 RepID=A0A8T0K6Z2_PHAAN|nr:O-methyltransferase 3 [Vigna angularis]
MGNRFGSMLAVIPDLTSYLNDAMASDAQLITSSVIEKCKGVFMGLESLVDVGGGTGTMGKVIAASFPQLECIVFDLPHVVSGLQGSENLKYVGGDMFEEIPPTDAILLKEIPNSFGLHLLQISLSSIFRQCRKEFENFVDMRKNAQGFRYDDTIFFDNLLSLGSKTPARVNRSQRWRCRSRTKLRSVSA